MEISGLDDIDNRIIELLRENARMSYSEIGNAVGKSRVAVKTRIDQLEKKGIIRGYHAEIDAGAEPGGIRFFLDIETEPQCYEAESAGSKICMRHIQSRNRAGMQCGNCSGRLQRMR